MGNNCSCSKAETNAETNLSQAAPSVQQRSQNSFSRKDSRNLSSLREKSVSQTLEENDYRLSLFMLGELADTTFTNEKVDLVFFEKYKVNGPLRIKNKKAMEIFLQEKEKHNFLSPSNSPFMETLALIERFTRGEHVPDSKISTSHQTLNFLLEKVESKRLSAATNSSHNKALSNTTGTLKSALRTSRHSKNMHKKVKLVSTPEVHGLEEDKNSLSYQQLLQSRIYSEIGPWPYPDVDNSHLVSPVRFPSGELFFGCLVGTKKQGYGIQVWPNGAIYEGWWHENLPSVYGMMIFSDGDVFAGEWESGEMNGLGVFTSYNKFEFLGNFKHGEPHGKGEERWDKENVKIFGEWNEGKREGYFDISNGNWAVKGSFEGVDSKEEVEVSKSGLLWEVNIKGGTPEGPFTCLIDINEEKVKLLGELNRGRIEKYVELKSLKTHLRLKVLEGKLVEANFSDRKGKIQIKNGLIVGNELSDQEKEFIKTALEGLEDVIVPFS